MPHLKYCSSRLHGRERGVGVWAVVWCVFNIACLAAVLYGLAKNNMQFLLPALGYSTKLAWFAAIWLLAIFALTVYYALGLVTLLDGVEEVTTAQEGPAPSGELGDAVHHV